jgi:maltose alpha-D-glucosyltransferase/alpha-amylase
MKPRYIRLKDDPEWFKDAVVYQLHIKAYNDADGNGIGDFQGLIKKLDYLQELGVTAIWLLPFYPSPLRDDGYDIADYLDVHPDYGTLRDFREFLKSAHYRGMRVITELVLNHTSDQHRWFQLARRAGPDNEMRDYYVWSETPNRYQDARIIFKDFETSNWTWDPVAGAYFWHRFYSHQPDLNFDNPRVHKALLKIIDFWLDMGVDGLRLDAVPYLYEREGTNCENLPETHQFLKKLRAHVDEHYQNRMLLAEANQWPEDAVAYFGHDDECHMAFHFPIMPRLFMALWMEDRFPVIDILEQTPSIPQGCQWAMFLRNHDELTLEMVTDEERDYMYRIYAKDPRARINLGIRRRLAPLLNNNRRKIELLNFLLFSLPGTPIIYYGDEIGMGDNYFLGDRNGVRTPMQWSPDRNAGFSRSNPHHLYLPVILDPEYHFEVVNVENQDKNPSSLLWWMRRIIAMRKRFKALSRGSIEFLYPENPKVLAFIREHDSEVILVVINLSRFAQVAELDLSRFAGYLPVETFSGNAFPLIRESPYVFTLGIHDFFWFTLTREEEQIALDERQEPPEVKLQASWEELVSGENQEQLESTVLPLYLRQCRWFGSKARSLRGTQLCEDIPVHAGQSTHHLLLVDVFFAEGASERYLLPIAFMPQEQALAISELHPQAVLAKLTLEDTAGILYDSVYSEEFRTFVFQLIHREKHLQGQTGRLGGMSGRSMRGAWPDSPPESQVLKGEQSNTSFLYENAYVLKLYRKLEEGINPDSEITAYLTEKTDFENIPPFAGLLEYRRTGSDPLTIGQMQRYVPNQGDAWAFTMDNLEHYFEYLQVNKPSLSQAGRLTESFYNVNLDSLPEELSAAIGSYFLEMIDLLGRITGRLHLALAEERDDPAFKPEDFSKLYQRGLYQSIRSLVRRTLHTLKRTLPSLDEDEQQGARQVLEAEADILDSLAGITSSKITTQKIRVHGDYHLGQVLYTGNNFIILDFEGEPARPLSERRLKRSAFKDVAGMIRSFHYAAHSGLDKETTLRPESPSMTEWIAPWFHTVSGVYLSAYLDTVGGSAIVPPTVEERNTLLEVFLLEKAVYEIGYEMNNRPKWLGIPIKGILHILGRNAASTG